MIFHANKREITIMLGMITFVCLLMFFSLMATIDLQHGPDNSRIADFLLNNAYYMWILRLICILIFTILFWGSIRFGYGYCSGAPYLTISPEGIHYPFISFTRKIAWQEIENIIYVLSNEEKSTKRMNNSDLKVDLKDGSTNKFGLFFNRIKRVDIGLKLMKEPDIQAIRCIENYWGKSVEGTESIRDSI